MGTIREPASPRTTVETFLSQAGSLGERPFLYFHRDGEWRRLTWAEARDRVLRVAAALVAEGVRAGDRVVLISENRFEWMLADLGIQAAGAVSVPVFPSLLPATVRAIVQDSGAVVGLAGREELACKLQGADSLRRVFSFDSDLHRWFQRPPSAAELDELRRRASRLDRDDEATIVYTSGTTGESKGVVLTHRNLVDMAASDLRALRIDGDDVLLSALPYAHVLERVSGVFNVITAGAQVWVSHGHPRAPAPTPAPAARRRGRRPGPAERRRWRRPSSPCSPRRLSCPGSAARPRGRPGRASHRERRG